MKQTLFAVLTAAALVRGQAPGPVVAIRAARLVDGTGGAPIAPAVVVVRGENRCHHRTTHRKQQGRKCATAEMPE